MPVTLKDVAERAGVSRSAVSRAFTPGASVSAKTREKIEKAVAELGYSPNVLASSLSTGRTKLIGIVVSNFKNPLFLETLDHFTRGLQDRGLRPLLVNLSGETDPEASVRLLQQYSVDAVVVASSTLPPSFAKAFRDSGLAVVHTFGRRSSNPQVHVVGIDNVEGGRLAARELHRRGYRKVHFLGGPETATTTIDRLQGFTNEVAKLAGMSMTISFASAYTFDAGRTEMQRLMGEGVSDAYFCGDDVLSIGAMSVLEDAGIGVPDPVGILGFNDMEIARWNNIALTTIRQPIEDIVAASIDQVVATLNKPDSEPKAHLFPVTLIDRGTLRPAAK